MSGEHSRWGRAGWVRGSVFLVSLILLAWGVHAHDLGNALHQRWIDDHVLGHGLGGYALFFGLAAAFTALGLPRQIPSLLAGYAFGVVVGVALALLSTVVGAAGAYGYARAFGRGLIPAPLQPKLARVERSLARGPFATALILRLLPVGSNLVTNLVAGLVRLPVLPFLAGSCLGFAPQTLVFALMGKGLRIDPVWRIGLAVVLFAASAWLSHHLYRMQTRAEHRAQTTAATSPSPGTPRKEPGATW